jgi:type I restriction enzyme S subunit
MLSDLDSKIELNNKINYTLEVISQILFKQWFIDFEFPNEKGKPYKSSSEKMVYSEELEKEIPMGWQIKELNAFIDLQKGLSYKGKYLSDNGKPMVNLGTMAPFFGFIYDGLKHYDGEYKERHLVKAGDIVIANTDITQKRDVLGSPAIVPPDLGSEEILFTHHIYAVRNESKLPNLFIYYLIQQNEIKHRARGFATGTTVLALPKDAILNFKFAVPDEVLIKKFHNTTKIFRLKIDLNNIQNKTLNALRDFLLPKLISGKVRIKIPEMEAKS